ncbi:hypothetical protein [Microbacterium hydrothermale]|uniref:hypothetical protein n=1 Tax=Microbacterium hydrothermale TaxID=857427 RepID=UPI0010A8F442|nr:hypothetical protein [Microbacterium hydrothermale]
MLTRKTPLFVSAVLAASIALAPGPLATAAERGAPQTQIVADSSSAVVGEQAQPDSEAEAGRLAFVLIPLIGAAVVVVGAIVVISRGRRRRRGD